METIRDQIRDKIAAYLYENYMDENTFQEDASGICDILGFDDAFADKKVSWEEILKAVKRAVRS